MHYVTDTKFTKRLGIVSAVAIGFSSLAFSGVTNAASAAKTTDSTQAKGTAIIAKGDEEITRRLATLNKLTGKINAATKLSASDKGSLTDEVSTEIANLTSLKTKLDAETTAVGAKADAQSIITDYRVYALVVPKIQLVKTADDQQVVETKLTALASKLQTRIDSAKTAGKNVTSAQSKLDDLKTQTANAAAISGAMETKVLNLQPSDYNGDHTLLSGDAAQLKQAHNDNQSAYADAKSVVAALKNS